MLSKLTRRSLNSLMIRGGGHGWARPDPPVPESYVHKREVLF
jgi:hypothetical protein